MLKQHIPPIWRQVLRQNFTQWKPLADYLQLDDSQREAYLHRPDFPLNLPLRLAQKIMKQSVNDPILRQFLPTKDEQGYSRGFCKDPVGEEKSRETPKLLHKYEGRVLLVCTSACAMHCRYCFRQNFDYEVAQKGFDKEIAYIEADPSIREVILSGGDPLSLSDEELAGLFAQLRKVPHVRQVRFHTRFPMGIPERIDAGFLEMIESLPWQIWFVIHANHPREFDQDIFDRLKQLQKRGVSMLCQSVLLSGVNDSVEVLVELAETLVNHGIMPYYLHQLDRVVGAYHFEVPEKKGLWLIEEMAKRLPGYAVPKYVREVAGEPGKTNII